MIPKNENPQIAQITQIANGGRREKAHGTNSVPWLLAPKKETKESGNRFAALVRSVVEWLRPNHRISQERISKEPSLTPEEFRRMLEETLAADPEMARMLLKPLIGAVIPIVGGMPSGTKNKIAKFDSAGTDVVDTVAPIFENSSGKVGIGTTNPARLLDLNVAASTQSGIFIRQNSSAARVDLGVFSTGAAFLKLYDGSDNQQAQITSSGENYFLKRVGIGTSDPDRLLDLNVPASTQDGLIVRQNGSAARVDLGIFTTGAAFLKLYDGSDNQQAQITSSGDNYFLQRVGIGTSTPDSKLDVRGSINKIVFLRAVGGSHDDGADINTAIANLPDNGGIIYLMPGTFNIKTTIRNGNKKSVKLRGFGGAAIDGEVGPTILKWDTSSSESNKRVIEFKPNTLSQHWDDFEISDVTIDGNASALTGLYLNGIFSSKFINVQIQNMNKRTASGQTASIGFELTTSANGTQDTRGTAFNMFLNCSVWLADIGVILTGGTSDGLANSTHNTFVCLNIGYYAKITSSSSSNAGIVLGDCDNNCIIRAWIFPILDGGITDAPGVLIEKASPDSETVARHARANYFYHLEAAVDREQNPTNISFWIKKADLNKLPRKNLVFGYDLENSQGQPRAWNNGTELSATDVKKFLFWIDTMGDIRGGQFA